MKNKNIHPALKLSWPEVGRIVSDRITVLLGHTVVCSAAYEDESYWSVSAENYRFPVCEIQALLQIERADEETRIEAIPIDSDTSCSLGLNLSSLILQDALQANWETEYCEKEALWLLAYRESQERDNEAQADLFQFPGVAVFLSELKSSKELLDFLDTQGPTHTSLMEYCDEYRKQYRNELCWSYPISDGKHLGTFLVLVQEGVLSLPYDEADKEDYELFCLEDAVLFRTAEEMDVFIDDWIRFNDDLDQAMQSMRKLLLQQEEANDEKDKSKH